jgi:large subunit ribosomal protein L31
MKKGIHPKFYNDAKITDTSSGKTFVIGSTVEEMNVEISSLTHPFYTGKQRIVDSENLVAKFEEKRKKADLKQVKKKKKKKVNRKKSSVSKVEKKDKVTLKDMLKQFN